MVGLSIVPLLDISRSPGVVGWNVGTVLGVADI